MYPQLQSDVIKQQEMQQPYTFSKSEEFTNPPPVYDQTISIPLTSAAPIYDANAENPKTTKVVRYGSMLLFIGTFQATLCILADLIGGTFYITEINHITDYHISPHNSIGETYAKVILMLINAIILITSAVFGILSTNKGNAQKSKYSLLHLAFLIIGMLVFLGEIGMIHASFFGTGYESHNFEFSHLYYRVFVVCLIIFTVLSVIGLIGCCVCCVSGCVRYKNINLHDV